MPRLDRVDAPAEPNDVRDELGHALVIDATDDQPVALVVELTVASKGRERGAIETGGADPHRVAAQEFVERPLSDADLEAKFHSLADAVIGKAKAAALIDACWKLGGAKNVSVVVEGARP